MDQPLIALLTDFGQEDYFVASLKAVILSLNPEARLLDISHSVRSFDVRSAAFLLQACFRFFPSGTIFLAIVDPGVGSGRRILAAETDRHKFIAPDNGLLSSALETSSERRVRAVTNTRYFLSDSPTTFEGRDRLAPLAAWLSLGVPAAEFGPLIDDPMSLPLPKAYFRHNEIIGHVAYIDKFGDVITDIPAGMLPLSPGAGPQPDLKLTLRKQTISHFRQFYTQGGRSDLFFLVGSLGLVEIAQRQGSAAAALGAELGDVVVVQAGA
jgi:S-adenosylmethionine hydrolase